jgi:PAS domain S-box-containing protein
MGTRGAAWAVSMVALAAALLLRWLLDPVLGESLSLVTLFGAVAAAVWFGGLHTGFATAVLGYAACNYLFIEPRGIVALDRLDDQVGLAAYAFTCALIVGFGEAVRRAAGRSTERGEVLRVTLASIGDAVITTDLAGRVTYLNAVAEELTGWPLADAAGQPLESVFRIIAESDRSPVESPATRALREGVVVGLANHTLLIARDGRERPIDDSAAPIRDEQGRVSGCVLIFRDVSERRSGERQEAGRLSDARVLASIVESSDDAIVSKSLDGTIQSWNAGAQRLFGWTAEQAVGRHISLIIPQDRLAEETEIIAQLAAGRRVEHFETERRRSDGQLIRVSLTISPVHDDHGKVVGASKIARDVTHQRAAEERERRLLTEAADAHAKFHAFFDQSALLAGLVATDGTLLEANRASFEGCGYTREQGVGQPFWAGPWWTGTPASVERVRQACLDAAVGETFRGELAYRLADGSERCADLTIPPIKDDTGRVLFLAPTWADVTERKRAEADRQQFFTLAETSTDFIGMCDLDGTPFYVNAAGLAMVGLANLDEARRVHVSEFFLPEDRARVLEEFFPVVMASGHGELDIRFRNFKSDETRWMAYKVLLLRDDEGRPVAFATVSRDVTERRHLADDLRRLAQDLSEADRRKDEFLATLAHELRNPLAPLSNLLEVLKHTGADGPAFRQALDTMGRQLGQLVRLVDDLLDMNRITHNRLELRRDRVELVGLVEQVVETARPLADSARHALRVHAPREPIHLHADPVRLAQVFGNLLNNSCRYTPSGGTITVRVEREGREAVVSVVDTGSGIPADQLERIFDMFMQVDRSLERAQGGLGIGLTLVKRLVEMHGGSVQARSAGVGRGSEFVVRLPIAPVEGAAAAPSARRADAQAPRVRRILVVDDNQDAAASLALLLEISGHEVHVAHDGAQALEAAAKYRPEVVLLDIGLPVVNGYDVCQKIRHEAWGRPMMIVALTGWGQEEDRDKSHQAGFNDHLVKPVDYDALVALLDALPD